MVKKIGFLLYIFYLTVSLHAQEDYTIPRKHRVIQEKEVPSHTLNIGASVPEFTFTSIDGNSYTSTSIIQKGPVVLIFLSVECPVAQRYTMRLKRMHSAFKEKHVTIVGIYSNENDTKEDVITYNKKAQYPFPIVKDTGGSLARHLGATMTPQAHVIDTEGVLRYRGAIDDNRYETRIKHNYLKNTITALLDRKPVPVKETAAFGCTIHLPDLHFDKQITYTEHIAPILKQHCLTCHHHNGITPITLEDYEDATKHASKIVETTHTRLMPPWNPVYGYVKLKNERYLSDSQIDMISHWVKTGTPTGPQVKDKLEPDKSETWVMGKPDMVLTIPVKMKQQSYEPDNIHTITIQPNFEKDMYIRGIDFQIENKKTVYGIIAKHNLSTSSTTRVTRDGRLVVGPKPTNPKIINQNILGIWSPSTSPTLLPEGVGFWLHQHAHLILLLNYNPAERSEVINMRMGVYFSNSPITTKVRIATLSTKTNSNQNKAILSHQFQSDVYVLGVFPTRQQKTQELRVIAKTPLSDTISMLWTKPTKTVWNEIYYYEEPIFIPNGSRLEFDVQENSEKQQLPKSPYPTTANAIIQFYYVSTSDYIPQ